MLAKLTLQTLLAATIVGALAFAWQARDEGIATAAASLSAVLQHSLGQDD